MADQCENQTEGLSHMICYLLGNTNFCADFKYGARQRGPIAMKAGQTVNVIVEWDFSDPSKVKDWSLTAYGAKGPLTVKHPTWKTSDTFPFIPRKTTVTPTPTLTPTPTPKPKPTPKHKPTLTPTTTPTPASKPTPSRKPSTGVFERLYEARRRVFSQPRVPAKSF